MAKTIIASGRVTAWGTAANQAEHIPISGEVRTSTTASNIYLKFHTAGTLKNMAVNLTGNSLSVGVMTIRTVKEGTTDLNLSISLATATTGIFEDTTNTDTVTANDNITIKTIPTSGETGTVVISTIKVEYDTDTSTSNTITTLRNSLSSNSATAASTTYYTAFTGGGGSLATIEADCQWKMQYSATLKNMGVHCNENSRTTATTVRLRKNGADGNQSISIPTTTNGAFYDTTNTDTVAANDLVCYSTTNGNSTEAIRYRGFQVDYQTTTNPAIGIVGVGTVLPATVKYTEPITRYLQISGHIDAISQFTTETHSQTKLREAWTFKGLTVSVRNNDVATASTVTFRKGAADTALTVSITGATTGFFQDVTNTVTIASGDLVNYIVTTPASGGTRYLGISNVVVYTEIAGQASANIDMDVSDTMVLTNKFITKV